MTIRPDAEVETGGFAIIDIELPSAPAELPVAVRYPDYDEYLGETGEHSQRPHYFTLERISASGNRASYSLPPNITHFLHSLDILQFVAKDGRHLTGEVDWPNVPPSSWLPGQPVPSRSSLLKRAGAAEEEAIARQAREEAEREAKRLKALADAEAARKQAEAEAARKQAEADAARRQAEADEAARLQAEAADAARLKADAEAARLKEAADAAAAKAAATATGSLSPPVGLKPKRKVFRWIAVPLLLLAIAGGAGAAYRFGWLEQLMQLAQNPQPPPPPPLKKEGPAPPPVPDAETLAFDAVKACLVTTPPCEIAKCTRDMAVKFDTSRYDSKLWELIESNARICKPLRTSPALVEGKYRVKRGWKVPNFTNCKGDYPGVEVTVSRQNSTVEFTSGGTRWSGTADVYSGMIDFVDKTSHDASNLYAARALGHWTGAAMVSRVCGVGTLSLEPVR